MRERKEKLSVRFFALLPCVRHGALRLKLNVIPSEIEGKSVLLVDDSIVRGATLRRVIALLRSAGAASVHLAIHSPPVRHPCFYGIDMSTEEELFARRFDEDLDVLEAAASVELGADSLTYLSVEGMDRAFTGPRCGACFDGKYPFAMTDESRQEISGHRRQVRVD